MILHYYSRLLGSENIDISPLSVEEIRGIHPFCCGSDLSSKLSMIPIEAEIREAVLSLPKDKAPGPDGFSVEFFSSTWDLVGSDLISAVKDFFLLIRVYLDRLTAQSLRCCRRYRGQPS